MAPSLLAGDLPPTRDGVRNYASDGEGRMNTFDKERFDALAKEVDAHIRKLDLTMSRLEWDITAYWMQFWIIRVFLLSVLIYMIWRLL